MPKGAWLADHNIVEAGEESCEPDVDPLAEVAVTAEVAVPLVEVAVTAVGFGEELVEAVPAVPAEVAVGFGEVVP